VTLVVPTNLGPSGKSPKKRPLSLEAKLSKKDAKTDTKHEASEDKDLSTAPMVNRIILIFGNIIILWLVIIKLSF